MNYSEQVALAKSNLFFERVMQAALEIAIAVSEENSSGDYDVDVRRVTLAQDVMRRSNELAPRFALAVATLIGDAKASDAEVKTAVVRVWNAFAGLNPKSAKPVVTPVVVKAAEAQPVNTPVVAAPVEDKSEPLMVAAIEEEGEVDNRPWYKKLFG
jgi:hypothetical protein